MSAWRRVDGDLELALRVTPKGGRDRVEGIVRDGAGRDWLAVRVAAPAEGGKANRMVCRLLAKTLGVPASTVALVSGATSRHKRVRITGAGKDAEKRLRRIAVGRAGHDEGEE